MSPFKPSVWLQGSPGPEQPSGGVPPTAAESNEETYLTLLSVELVDRLPGLPGRGEEMTADFRAQCAYVVRSIARRLGGVEGLSRLVRAERQSITPADMAVRLLGRFQADVLYQAAVMVSELSEDQLEAHCPRAVVESELE